MLLARYTVIGGDASQDLAKRISRRLKAEYIGARLRVFPDGEQKITLTANPGRGTIIIVQSTPPPVDSNLIQALSLVHKAGENGSKVFAVIPYIGYARQDKEFLSGEIVTMKTVAGLLRSAGASKVFVIDIHSKAALKQFKSAGRNISAIPDLARYLKKQRLNNPLIVSPDLGGAERAREFAELFNSGFVALEKRRDRRTGSVRIVSSDLGEVRNRDLILVDDMISTGGSIIKATKFLKKQGCRRIFVACTHSLLINDAEAKIRKAGVTGIISTNTIPGDTSVVDVSATIAKAIQDS